MEERPPVEHLPPELQQRHQAIIERFAQIEPTWVDFPDELIPEDRAFAKEIVEFLLDAIKHAEEQYETIDREQWREFFVAYEWHFVYGDEERNYLCFDEGDVRWMLIENIAQQGSLTHAALMDCRQDLEKVLERLTVPVA